MEEFLKELSELCKKHGKYISGCGCEDDTTMVINQDWSKGRFYYDSTLKEYKKEE